MRPLGVVLGLIVTVVAVSIAIWMARYAPWVPASYGRVDPWDLRTQAAVKQETEEKAKAEIERKKTAEEYQAERPPIADKPPFPKIGPCEKVFAFGRMAINEERKHTFKLTNVGEGTLRLSKGPSTCKCTIGKLARKVVAPHESVEIEVSWTPREYSERFSQVATIYSNDPDLSQIDFKINGKVVQEFILSPSGTWEVGAVTDAQEGKTSGMIGTAMEDLFKITSIETPHPAIKATVAPMDRHEARREGIVWGYKINVTVGQGIPLGAYRGRLKIHTTINGSKTVDAEIHAVRTGPILFLPPIGSALWSAERSHLDVGRFSHKVGKKIILPGLVYAMKDKFQILGVKSDLDFLKVTTEPNPNASAGSQQGINFIFEIPPGAPPVTRVTPESVHVVLQTNHPTLKQLPFDIDIASF